MEKYIAYEIARRRLDFLSECGTTDFSYFYSMPSVPIEIVDMYVNNMDNKLKWLINRIKYVLDNNVTDYYFTEDKYIDTILEALEANLTSVITIRRYLNNKILPKTVFTVKNGGYISELVSMNIHWRIDDIINAKDYDWDYNAMLQNINIPLDFILERLGGEIYEEEVLKYRTLDEIRNHSEFIGLRDINIFYNVHAKELSDELYELSGFSKDEEIELYFAPDYFTWDLRDKFKWIDKRNIIWHKSNTIYKPEILEWFFSGKEKERMEKDDKYPPYFTWQTVLDFPEYDWIWGIVAESIKDAPYDLCISRAMHLSDMSNNIPIKKMREILRNQKPTLDDLLYFMRNFKGQLNFEHFQEIKSYNRRIYEEMKYEFYGYALNFEDFMEIIYKIPKDKAAKIASFNRGARFFNPTQGELIELVSRWHAACVIKRILRKAVSDPAYTACQRRLAREFAELTA